MTGAETARYPSPDGVYVAVTQGRFYNRVMITSTLGQTAVISQMKEIRFVGWTADSRYALVNFYSQYGDSLAVGFDTTTWDQFLVPLSYKTNSTMCLADTTGSCSLGAEAIAPLSSRVLLREGVVIDLERSGEVRLLSGVDENAVTQATWSPDEQYLALVAYIYDPYQHWDYSGKLYFWREGAMKPEALTPLDGCFVTSTHVCYVSWDAEGHIIIVTSESGTQTFDVEKDIPE